MDHHRAISNELQNFYEEGIKVEQNDNYEVNYTTMNIGLINGGNSINSVSEANTARSRAESYSSGGGGFSSGGGGGGSFGGGGGGSR